MNVLLAVVVCFAFLLVVLGSYYSIKRHVNGEDNKDYKLEIKEEYKSAKDKKYSERTIAACLYYYEVHIGELSERSIAEQIGVPRSTLRCLRKKYTISKFE